MATATAISAAALLATLPARADVLLSYTGNAFNVIGLSGSAQGSVTDPYTTSDFVSGSLRLSSQLAANLVGAAATPLSFQFQDGVNNITNGNATGTQFLFWTDSTGLITQWDVFAQIFDAMAPASFRGISTKNVGDSVIGVQVDVGQQTLCYGCDPGNVAYASNGASGPPGSWAYSDVVGGPADGTVPEPSTLLLVLGACMALAYRQMRPAAAALNR